MVFSIIIIIGNYNHAHIYTIMIYKIDGLKLSNKQLRNLQSIRVKNTCYFFFVA